jgi:transposase InsO family protein
MQQHITQYRMKSLCEALSVSRSGYRAWLHRPANPYKEAFKETVSVSYRAHKGRAGAPSITAEIKAKGFNVSVRTVGRIMQRLGLRARGCRKFKRTTDSNHKYAASPNLLDRQFTVARPNQVWVGDITYIRTDEGWLYLAVLLDLYSRQVVGWQISTRIDRQLVCDALQAAILTRGKPEGVMVHSDQGVQYVSKDYRALITQYQLTQSMSRRGNCWDNAVAESFFATLKKQAVYGERFLTRQEAQQHIFEYIECYYNRVRRHSTNNWLSPVDYETAYYNNIEGASVHLID